MLNNLDADAQWRYGRKGYDQFSEQAARCFGAGSYTGSKDRVYLRENGIPNRPTAFHSTGERPG